MKTFTVVVTTQEQYCLWETSKPLPAEWRAIEVTSTQEECADYAGRKIRE